ncbi:MAG: type II toxin-antitoxin system HicB family antitoxin [Bacteroidetes bacterium]|nr:type II toxin-antitoxin system HicB family antitoxin [Bacteroidota bacterium]
MLANYTIIIVKSEDWYAGYVKELPGAHSQGKTIDEVKENLKEAIKMILESNYNHFTLLCDFTQPNPKFP